uniref:Putative ral n=1 Tax=Corethrella appendiculata TaxID=1370023 RepID=U5EXH6_9DIPT
MDFDSPDVEDFPGLCGKNKKEEKDFSDTEGEKKNRKGKDKKEKKTAYATLESFESSPEDEHTETKSPSKSKKSKAFKFPSKSKEKREKSREKEKVEPVKEPASAEKKKDKDKKEKDKKEKSKDKKEKKLKQGSVSEEVSEIGDFLQIFGVSLGLAVERNRCHDDINLPLIVRDCIDYLQEHGLQSEQIYKVDSMKQRLQHIKKLYNNREPFNVTEFDVPSACGLLKLFLKELPEPILTTDLSTRFEEAASHSSTVQQEQELTKLIEQLPNVNRTLLAWIILHLDAVTQNEKFNKINAQNIAMLLSPTLQMSHRLLVAILCHCSSLFSDTELSKYIPPITASSPVPETPEAIAKELRKQESLLAQIHAEMNAGFITKKREEQLWEVQRIITQLKRKLRSFEKHKSTDCTQQKSMDDTVDGDLSSIKDNTCTQTKLSCSDDESSLKTVTGLSIESATNTETKPSPQEQFDDGAIVSNIEEKSQAETIEAAITSSSSPPVSSTAQSIPITTTSATVTKDDSKITINENGMLMLPQTHPEYLNLIRLQIENQELLAWKSQLQTRINAERAEIVRMKRILFTTTADAENNNSNCAKDSATIITENTSLEDSERLIAHYLKENALLEQKKMMLAKEIFDEHCSLIQMQIDLAMTKYYNH